MDVFAELSIVIPDNRGFSRFCRRPPDKSDSQLQRQQHLWDFLLHFPYTIIFYDCYYKCWRISRFKIILLEVFIFKNTLVVDTCVNREWKRHYTKKTISKKSYSVLCQMSRFKAELRYLSRKSLFSIKTPLTVTRQTEWFLILLSLLVNYEI